MKINVTENKVSIKEEQILNENEYNIHKIQFDFSSEYTDDLVKVALFSIDNHTYKKIISNNECDIPPEVLTQRGYSILGVYAYKTEQDTLVLRYSPSPTRISVYDGSYKAEAENSEPITPSEIEQYQQILQNSLQQFQNQYNALVEETEGDIQAIENELQRKVDEGYFDGEDGFSPIANVIQLSNGAKIEIEDKTGRTSASVFNGYSPQRGVDYWTQEDKEEVIEEATQQIEGKIEEYNENAAEKLNQYNQNSVQKTNDYNTNAEQKMSAYNTNATEKFNDYNSNAEQKEINYNTNASQKVESFNTNANSKLSEYNSNAETKKTAYDENATQKTNSFNTNATNKLIEYNTNHTEKMSVYNSNSIQKLNAFNENATQKTEDFDEHTEEIQDNIEILQRTDNQILSRFNKDEEVSGQDITLTGTTEIKFAKPPLPMGNSEQDGEPSPTNEVPINNVLGDVEVVVQNKNLLPAITGNTVEGITLTQNADGSFIINGTASAGGYKRYSFGKTITFPAGNYTIYFENSAIGSNGEISYDIVDIHKDLRFNKAIKTTGKHVFYHTINEDLTCTSFNTWVSNGVSINNAQIYMMIISGTHNEEDILKYVKHKEQAFTFPLGNEKLMLGDYLADDGIHHVRGQVMLNENLFLQYNSKPGQFYIANQTILQNYKNATQIYSNYFKYSVTSWEENCLGITSNNTFWMYIKDGPTTLTELHSWLSTHNVTVEYKLEEEVIVPYTSAQQKVYNQIKNAYSYDEMTIITGSSDGNKPFFIVQAYKDLNKELNKNSNLVNGSNTGSLRSIGASDENSTYTMGTYAFAEGNLTKAEGFASHAEGTGTTANGDNQHVQGKNNIEDDNNKYAHIVGNGQDYQHPSNAHTVDWQGNGWFQGNVKVGGTSQDDTNAQNLITEDKYNRLKATLPTTGEVTGQAITLNKTAELEFIKPPLPMGNSEQETREGRNKFDISSVGFVYGGTIQDDVVTSNTLETASISNVAVGFSKVINVTAGETIYFSADIKLNTGSTASNWNINDSVIASTTKILSPTLSTSYQRFQTSITYSEDSTISQLLFQLGNLTGSFKVSNIMVSKSNNSIYEKYGATPSLEFESPITNVTGDVEVKVQNKNLFDSNSSNFNASWDGGDANKLTLLADGNIQTTADYSFWRAKAIDIKSLKPNTQYTLSIELISATSTQTNKAVIRIPYNNGTSGGHVDFNGNESLYQFNSLGKQTFTFTTPSDMVHIGLSLNSDGSDTTAVFGNIMIEKGSSATTYVEHKEQKFIFPLGNEKLMLGDYLADDGIHHKTRELNLAIADMNNGEDYPGWKNLSQLKTDYPSINNSFTAAGINYKSNLSNEAFRFSFNTLHEGVMWLPPIRWGNIKQSQWKTNYPNLILKFQYELEEEVIVPYTSAQQEVYNAIKQSLSYEEQTNITGSSNENNPIFNVEAYQSTKLVLEERDAKYESLEARVALLE